MPRPQDLGLEIGRDVSVIGYDGIPECRYARPALTTFAVDSRMAGQRLATLLIRQIRGEDPATLRELTEATLVEGESDGPPGLKRQTELAQETQQRNNDHNREETTHETDTKSRQG